MPATPGRSYYLPRLDREFYRGNAVVMWTITTIGRTTGWLNDLFHSLFRELMLHTAVRHELICPTYCLMPDHGHLIWMGLGVESDQLAAMAFLRTHITRLLNAVGVQSQKQAHDHVLRDEERRRNSFSRTCEYILLNPVRAGLVKHASEWSFSGCIVSGYPALHPLAAKYWRIFWDRYHESLTPAATQRKLPRDQMPNSAPC